MKKVTLWNLSQNRAEEMQGQPITVASDRPEFTAEQMMRNRDNKKYEARIEEADQEPELDI